MATSHHSCLLCSFGGSRAAVVVFMLLQLVCGEIVVEAGHRGYSKML